VVIFLVLKKIDGLIISSTVPCSFTKSSLVISDYSSRILCPDLPVLMKGYPEVEKILKKIPGTIQKGNPKEWPNGR
jgi:hypothetical protein